MHFDLEQALIVAVLFGVFCSRKPRLEEGWNKVGGRTRSRIDFGVARNENCMPKIQKEIQRFGVSVWETRLIEFVVYFVCPCS